MATTKAKESSGLGKERKSNVPSSLSLPHSQTKRTPKSSSSPKTQLSTDQKLPSPSSSSLSTLPEKNLPNYLKSTASSRHEQTFKITKKPAPIPDNNNNKPSLNRRRSFDRPPPTTPRLEKPFRSPGPRERASHVPIRSSSFGSSHSNSRAAAAAAANSAKFGLLERPNSKVNKVGFGKTLQPAAQNLKTNNANAKKSLKNFGAVSPKTSTKNNAVGHVDQLCSSFVNPGVEEEEITKIECDELDSTTLPDPIVPELHTETRNDQRDMIRNSPSPSLSAAETKTPADQDGAKFLIQELKTRESIEHVGEDKKEEENESVVAAESEKSENHTVIAEEKSGTYHDQEEENNSKLEEADEGEMSENSMATTGKQRQGSGSGKKETATVYNDVIEETASKLLETRKNKVKALAGAFQTVIDFESSSK